MRAYIYNLSLLSMIAADPVQPGGKMVLPRQTRALGGVQTVLLASCVPPPAAGREWVGRGRGSACCRAGRRRTRPELSCEIASM